ncbi:MAG: hypothetical protein WBG98_13430, partial [Brucella anthropi]
QNIDLAQLRHDLFGFVLLLGHSNVLLRLNSLLQGGPLFRGQTSITNKVSFSPFSLHLRQACALSGASNSERKSVSAAAGCVFYFRTLSLSQCIEQIDLAA